MREDLTSPRRWVVALLVAAPLVIGWFVFNDPTRTVAQPGLHLGHLGAWALLAAGLLVARRTRRLALWVLAAAVAAVMALVRFAGAHYQPRERWPFRPLTWQAPLELVLDWAVLLVVCVVALRFLSRAPSPEPMLGRARPVLFGIIAGLAMLVCWAPYWMVYFPGIVGRDSWSSIIQGSGFAALSNHHPVLFTLWVGWCIDIAEWFGAGTTVAVAIFSVSQAVVFAAALGTCVGWLRVRVGRWGAVAAAAYFALDPGIALWSITMHKDTLFVAWVALLVVLLAETARRGLPFLARPWPLVALAGLLLAVSFSRNNGPYLALAVLLAVGALVLCRALLRGRRLGRTWLVPVVALAAVATTLAIQGPGYRQWGVIPSSRAESAGLQLHQIGWAVRYGSITSEQAATVEKMIPVARLREVYSPTIVDSVKFDPSFNKQWLNDHPEEFQQLWLGLMQTNPEAYAKAWYALSGGYLDVDRELFRLDPGTKRGQGYMVSVIDQDLLGPRLGEQDLPARLPPMLAQVITAPLLVASYVPAVWFWSSVLACGAALLRRRATALLPYVPHVALMATLLIASPLTDYRYVAAFHVGLPVLVSVLWLRPGMSGARADARQGEGHMAAAPASLRHPQRQT